MSLSARLSIVSQQHTLYTHIMQLHYPGGHSALSTNEKRTNAPILHCCTHNQHCLRFRARYALLCCVMLCQVLYITLWGFMHQRLMICFLVCLCLCSELHCICCEREKYQSQALAENQWGSVLPLT